MQADEAYQKRLTPALRASSSTLNEIMVELYRMREWFDWMKPMPPMSAARLKHQSMPATALAQFSGQRRSRFMNSLQNMSSVVYSFSFQSTARTKWPSSLRRLARCEAMKPPAPVMQILVPLGKSLVNVIFSMLGRTMVPARGEAVRRDARLASGTTPMLRLYSAALLYMVRRMRWRWEATRAGSGGAAANAAGFGGRQAMLRPGVRANVRRLRDTRGIGTAQVAVLDV